MAQPINEPILGYAPGSSEKSALIDEVDRQMSEVVEIPCIINGEEIFTGTTTTQVIPHDHGHILANVHLAGREEMEAAFVDFEWRFANSPEQLAQDQRGHKKRGRRDAYLYLDDG